MYNPPHFRVEDLAQLHGLIRARPLGLLITHGDSGLEASPIPFLLDAERGEKGVLRAHLARANTHLARLREGPECLVAFCDVDAYVSPDFYPSKREHGRVVPTWNYASVQVRGRARVMDDPEFLRSQIEALTQAHERARPAPWAVGDAPDNFIAAQMRGIVGLEIEIADIEGKWKVSQNRSAEDAQGVIAGLRASEREADARMADLVEAAQR
jgi:transcriptional regulator